MDERFFLYAEEVDLCLRMNREGWGIYYVPTVTIRHPWDREHVDSRLAAQDAFARRQYMAKHFSRLGLLWGITALAVAYSLRSILSVGRGRTGQERRRASREAFRVLLGFAPPPFGAPPRQAMQVGAHAALASVDSSLS
jgi:GT2 family glycosyltransferase